MFKATVKVSLKKTVLDPQGKTVKSALASMGFSSVEDVRMGKLIELNIIGSDKKKIEADLHVMCKKLLANPIIEDHSFTIEEA
jgi:phosphoribosylformylglycinamidine synthase PurS subunit